MLCFIWLCAEGSIAIYMSDKLRVAHDWAIGKPSLIIRVPTIMRYEINKKKKRNGANMDKPIDKRGVLDDEVFSYRASKDMKVFISYEGKPVITLSGKRAERFLSKIDGKYGKEAQLIMAKVTGNFKRGNEKLQ
jgi:hypothetical protein